MENLSAQSPRSTKNKSGLFGLVLILVGLVLIADQFDIFSYKVRDILFTWQSILIVIGLVFLTKKENKVTGGILILIGVFFLLPEFTILDYDVWKLFWPAVLIFAGIMILYHGINKRPINIMSSSLNGDMLEDVNVFGGHERIITNEHFKGGEIVNIFGGGKYNLLGSKLAPGNNILEMVMIFGGAKIIVPQDWDVKVDVVAIFGGFTDKRIIPSSGVDNAEKKLVIKGVAIFGGGEVASFDN
jgi:predicted membrane protein